MEVQALLSLVFSAFLLRRTLATTFTINNNCPYTVWPGTLAWSGSAQLSSTGFELTPGANFSLSTNAPWSGQFWGRTGCSTDASGRFSCTTGDCASGVVSCNGAGDISPVSLAEFTLATGSEHDNYYVSLMNGFNLPLSITPQGGTKGCQVTSCPANINSVCPAVFAVKDQDGNVIACRNACAISSEFAFCPRPNVLKFFKDQCPQAYTYGHDDPANIHTCVGATGYHIMFCP